MWLGGEYQEIWLGYDGSGCKCRANRRLWSDRPHVAEKLEQGLWCRWTEATVKSKRSCNRRTNKAIWWHDVDHIIQNRSSQVLICVDNQVAWWRMMEELHAMIKGSVVGYMPKSCMTLSKVSCSSCKAMLLSPTKKNCTWRANCQ
jgi:hypothetical protein